MHSILNIAGFSIGISSFILILLYVQSELAIDSFQQNRDRVYKITLGGNFNTMAPLAVIL
jgi:putative ABC transport system permease protein